MPNMTILVQVEMLAGSSLKSSLLEAKRLAKDLNVGITFTFNGYAMIVFDHSNLGDLEHRYHIWTKSKTKTTEGRYDNG